MKKLSLFIALIAICTLKGYTQNNNYISYHKARIFEKMSENNEYDLPIITDSKNDDDSYSMMYKDKKLPITQIYFFDKKYNICRGYASVIEDVNYLSVIIEILNDSYEKQKDSTWIETREDGEKFLWQISKYEWLKIIVTKITDQKDPLGILNK